MKCHNTTAGAQEEFQSSENEREKEQGTEEKRKNKEKEILGGRETKSMQKRQTDGDKPD